MTNHASPVEDVATAIAAPVRAKGWHVYAFQDGIQLWAPAELIATLHCQDASQAKRLAAMMQQPPEPVRGVFDAMGIDPVDPLERFPSLRGKA